MGTASEAEAVEIVAGQESGAAVGVAVVAEITIADEYTKRKPRTKVGSELLADASMSAR